MCFVLTHSIVKKGEFNSVSKERSSLFCHYSSLGVLAKTSIYGVEIQNIHNLPIIQRMN